MTTDHIDVETLSAFADGDLGAVAALRVERHLAACDACRRTQERLRALVVTAGALPREVAPPPEAWTVIKDRVTGHGSRITRHWWHNGWLAAAAAVALVAGTASLMLLSGGGKAKAAKLSGMPLAVSPVATPVFLAAVEKNYAPTLAELRETLELQRSALSPATIRTFEHALSVIDAAIAEARSALEADPGSAALMDLLSSSYQRKVEFLTRATALSSSL